MASRILEKVLLSSFFRVLSLSWIEIVERVPVFIYESVNCSRCTYWIRYVCHVKIWYISRWITGSFDHEIAVVQDISEKTCCWCIYFLYIIYGCLRHFSIEKFDLIIWYNTSIGQEKYIEFIIDPLYKYILQTKHYYHKYCYNSHEPRYGREFSYKKNTQTQSYQYE